MPLFVLFCLLISGCSKDSNPDKTASTESVSEATTEAVIPDTSNVSYENTLFDNGFVHQIDVKLADEDWTDLLDHAVDKTKYKADIIIDGEELKDVSFSTKGNSSLYFVAAEPDSSRFSFKVNFGKFVDGQTYHGLDKLNLNNNFCDATYMKDYFSYQLFNKAGVPAPLTSYVWLKVNGNDHGLYLAIEDEADSFHKRVYSGEGVIYKPEGKSLGLTLDDVKDIMENGLPMTKNPHGADLIYTDDALESYPDIFENAETEAAEEDFKRVIAALKDLSEGNPDKCLDTNESIRFFAAHNYLLNYDSYIGGMLHNLVLYENKGILGLLPWDYNLAFATFAPGTGKEVLTDATNIVNQGIDSPLIATTEDERPMWSWIVKDENYLKEYHDTMDVLMSDYFESGEFDKEYSELYEMLLPYVEKDPTAFYSADEYKKGCETLRQFCKKRTESIRKQLSGELESVSENQSDDKKVDASDINVMDMGAFVTEADR
jgi:spore coat protein CotH